MAGDVPDLELAGVPALVLPAGGAAATAPGRPATPYLRGAGLGGGDPIPPGRPAHPGGAGAAVVHQLPRDQRSYLRGWARRPGGPLVLLTGCRPIGAGAGRPLNLRPALHVVPDDGGTRQLDHLLPQPPTVAGPNPGHLSHHPGDRRPAGPRAAGPLRPLPDRPLAALHHPRPAAGPLNRRARALAAPPGSGAHAGREPDCSRRAASPRRGAGGALVARGADQDQRPAPPRASLTSQPSNRVAPPP